MKRFFALFLTMAMVLSLAACGGKKESAEPAADKNESASTETTNSDWPKKTINIYMTHGAGGDTDYMGRQLATALEGVLGQSVVVSNVTGSNGATCMQQYKDGDTDGYTFIATNTAALNGIDVLTFTAGVGENAPSTRAHILEGLEFMGITCDEEKNNVRGEERIISKDGAPVTVMVIPTNEELMIAQDTLSIVEENKNK